jgi:hypothetical protein
MFDSAIGLEILYSISGYHIPYWFDSLNTSGIIATCMMKQSVQSIRRALMRLDVVGHAPNALPNVPRRMTICKLAVIMESLV